MVLNQLLSYVHSYSPSALQYMLLTPTELIHPRIRFLSSHISTLTPIFTLFALLGAMQS